ncbi:DNA-3-methyladenine glycosylase I [candidate division KSB1 bacterium]|nr:DNA-3-methyladenine glycosylase I [candidate division KSB1 bacterium]
MAKERCAWCETDPLSLAYHDQQWGVPIRDDRKLFEMLILEGAQAGLSWMTILKKMENYRRAFDNFEIKLVAAYDETKIEALRQDPGIVRNRLKISAAVKNANAVLRIQDEFGSLDAFLWRYVDSRPQQNAWKTLSEIPANTKASDAMSKDLKQRGCSFVGSTICYAFMQSVGMVNDHTTNCFRYEEIRRLAQP